VIWIDYKFLQHGGVNRNPEGGGFGAPGAKRIVQEEDKIYLLYDGFPFRALLAERGQTASSGGAWSIKNNPDVGLNGPIASITFSVQED